MSRWASVVAALLVGYLCIQHAPLRAIYSPIDKFSHAAAFFLVWWILCWATRWDLRWNVVLASLLGAAIEIHQMFLPGFTPSWADWFADMVGIVLAYSTYTVWNSQPNKLVAPVVRDRYPQWMLALVFVMVMLSFPVRGDTQHTWLIAVEMLSLAAVFCFCTDALWRRDSLRDIWARLPLNAWERWALLGLLSCPVWLGALYLFHVPGGNAAGLSAAAVWVTLLGALPALVCCVAGLLASPQQLQKMLGLWVGVALFQAVLLALQWTGWDVLSLDDAQRSTGFGGTDVRRSYLGFLVLSLPLMLALWPSRLWSLARGRRSVSDVLAYLTVALLLFSMLVSGRYTGAVLGLCVASLSVSLFWPQKGNRWFALPRPFWVAASVLLMLLMVGGLDRAAQSDATKTQAVSAVTRMDRSSSAKVAIEFLPLGAGPGAVAHALAAHQGAYASNNSTNVAHSDFLRLMIELGVLAVVLPLMWLVVLVPAALRLGLRHRDGRRWSQDDKAVVAACVSLLMLVLLVWVGHPLRTPANAMLAAFLLGVVSRRPSTVEGVERAPIDATPQSFIRWQIWARQSSHTRSAKRLAR